MRHGAAGNRLQHRARPHAHRLTDDGERPVAPFLGSLRKEVHKAAASPGCWTIAHQSKTCCGPTPSPLPLWVSRDVRDVFGICESQGELSLATVQPEVSAIEDALCTGLDEQHVGIESRVAGEIGRDAKRPGLERAKAREVPKHVPDRLRDPLRQDRTIVAQVARMLPLARAHEVGALRSSPRALPPRSRSIRTDRRSIDRRPRLIHFS